MCDRLSNEQTGIVCNDCYWYSGKATQFWGSLTKKVWRLQMPQQPQSKDSKKTLLTRS